MENLYVNEQLEESRFNIPGIHISEKAIEGFIVQSPLRMKEKKKRFRSCESHVCFLQDKTGHTENRHPLEQRFSEKT